MLQTVLNPNLKSLADVLIKITVRRLAADRATNVQDDSDDEVNEHAEVADVAGSQLLPHDDQMRVRAKVVSDNENLTAGETNGYG